MLLLQLRRFSSRSKKEGNCAEKKKVFNFSTENFFCRHQKPEKKTQTQVDEYENQLSVIITFISVFDFMNSNVLVD